MNQVTKLPLLSRRCAFALLLGLAASVGAVTQCARAQLKLAQAMVPPTGMMDARHPMPMQERMLKRFPQPVRVGDLIGLPVLDEDASTLGHVREVVRKANGSVELIVSYSPWWGWFGRPVAVPIEAVGIAGRQIVSLDMPAEEYAKAVNWRRTDEAVLPGDLSIRIALARF
jgi:sporulation protein YlmC with PRC-barrel domain